LKLENGTFNIAISTASARSLKSLLLFEAKKAIITNHETEENDPLIFEAKRYLSIMTQFEQSQLILQSTSLSSYKGIGEREKIVSNYLEALTTMLDHENLSIKILCDIHMILMEGLIIGGESGVLRTKKNRVGAKQFCDPSQVPYQMDLYLAFVEEVMLLSIDMFSKAAMISLAFVDLHPFKDGNGRFMRIIVNWVLKRCGLPFQVSICSTLDHRTKYIKAIRDCCDSEHPVVAPFAIFLASCCNKDWQEVGKKQSKAIKEVSDDAVIRKAREDLKESDCLICHCPAPNIGVLCCGVAVHINCMNDWLAAASEPTCVNCRAVLPLVEKRMQQEVLETDDEEDTETMGDGRYDEGGIYNRNHGHGFEEMDRDNPNGGHSTTDDDDGDDDGDDDSSNENTGECEDDDSVVMVDQPQDMGIVNDVRNYAFDTQTVVIDNDGNNVAEDTESADADDHNVAVVDSDTVSDGDDNNEAVVDHGTTDDVDDGSNDDNDNDGDDNGDQVCEDTVTDDDDDDDDDGIVGVDEETETVDEDAADNVNTDANTVDASDDDEGAVVAEQQDESNIYICVYIYAYIFEFMRINIYIHIYIYIYIHINTYIYIYKCIYMYFYI
jgi:Fic family protein